MQTKTKAILIILSVMLVIGILAGVIFVAKNSFDRKECYDNYIKTICSAKDRLSVKDVDYEQETFTCILAKQKGLTEVKNFSIKDICK
jgi:flagellar basal body-associated protein FliL